jgi:transposase
MEDWVRKILENEGLKNVEVKKIGNNYYAYSVSSVYDKEKKRPRKVSGKYIGKITESGIIRKVQRNIRTVFEYGNSQIIYNILNDIAAPLRKHFSSANEIMAMASVKAIRNVPLKYIDDAYSKLYMSRLMDASLSHSTIALKLREIGSDIKAQHEFFKEMIEDRNIYLYDLSSIFSYSENTNLAERGYNKDHVFLDQINFSLLFSEDRKLPVALKIYPGSIRDVKTVKKTIEEFRLHSSIIVMDRGFVSIEMINYMSDNMRYIQPLRRNSKLIDYSINMKGSFTYRGRGIRYGSVKYSNYSLYIYEDARLRGEEISNSIVARTMNPEIKVHEERLGKISLISNLDKAPDEIYLIYKKREDIEQCFDAMKNEMENDKTYLRDNDAIRGYFFVSFIALYIHYRLLEILRINDLIGKYSVNELLFELSKVYAVEYSDDKIEFNEIPKRVESLLKKINMDILPKN